MSLILVDLGDEQHDVMINNAGWRGTVEVIRSLEVLEAQRLVHLETAWLGQQLSEDEAQIVGVRMVKGPLAAIRWTSNCFASVGSGKRLRSG